jgi:hypothetical protein
MNERDQVSALLLRIDNLLRAVSTLSSELAEERAQKAQILMHLENIERAHAVPLVYTVKQAAQRLNYSLDWTYRHLPELVPPLSQDPLRFPVQAIDALALAHPRGKGRRGDVERPA